METVQVASPTLTLNGQAPALEAPIAISSLPLLKSRLDGALRDRFAASDASAVTLSDDISRSYRVLLTDVVEHSGLGALIRSEGYALAAIGGFARGNSAMHSDWDTALINLNENSSISHPAFTQFSDIGRRGIEVKFGLFTPSSFDDVLTDKGRTGIMSLTALLKTDLLCGDAGTVREFARLRDAFIIEHYPILVAMLERSIQERQEKNGALFKLAEFNLKDCRGGLRDIDCIDWLAQLTQTAGYASPLSSQDLGVIESAREILLTAKHALHLSYAKTITGDVNDWNNARREKLLELFKRDSGELLPPRVVYETIYSASQQVFRILNAMLENCSSLSRESSDVAVAPPQSSQAIVTPTELGSLLKSGCNCARPLRELFESGRLTAIVPEFGYSEFFVDNAGFHRFPLGEHHVRTVEELCRLFERVQNGAFQELDLRLPEDSAPLLLAALLHDVAKPDEGMERTHPQKGAEIAYAVAVKLGFTEEQAQKTMRLVRDHMLISDMAGRSEFALITTDAIQRISDIANLQELLLLTLADKKESNPLAWTASRRDQLLGAYQQLKIALGDAAEYRTNLCDEVRDLLAQQGAGIEGEDIVSFISEITPEVLGFYSPLILAEKIRLLSEVKNRETGAEPPFRAKLILPEMTDRRLQLFFVSADSDGLLGRASSFLSQWSMSLRSALVDTRQGLACDYLSIQTSEHFQFLEDDQDRFLVGLQNAVLGKSARSKTTFFSPSTKEKWEAEGFSRMLKVTVQENEGKIALTVLDRGGREVFPIIAPVLERQQLSVVNAQIGCGNRGVRHYFELQPRESSSFAIDDLGRDIESAYRA